MTAPRVALVFALSTAILALFVTSGIGVFHAGVEYHLWEGPQACSGRVPGLSTEELKKILLGAHMVRVTRRRGRCGTSRWPAGTRSCRAGWRPCCRATSFVTCERRVMKTGEQRNPGDLEPRTLVERVIRVDQPQVGAVRIYEGQLAALRWTGRASSDTGRKIAAMARSEREHNATFDRMIAARRVRPTALSPLWSLAGFGLGVATALMGDKAAMACTVAVEETIEEHYADQAAQLGDDEAELRTTIEKFRADEIAHKEEALASGAEQAPALRGADLGHRGSPGSRSGCRRGFSWGRATPVARS